jgi:hypothetical protein
VGERDGHVDDAVAHTAHICDVPHYFTRDSAKCRRHLLSVSENSPRLRDLKGPKKQLPTYQVARLLHYMAAARACHAPHKDAAGREGRLAPVAQAVHTRKPLRHSGHSDSSGNIGAKSYAANSSWPEKVRRWKGHALPKAEVSVVWEHHPRSIRLLARTRFRSKRGRRRGRLGWAPVTTTDTTTTATTTAMAASATTPTTGTHPAAGR